MIINFVINSNWFAADQFQLISCWSIPIDQVGSAWLSCEKILKDAAMDFKAMAREIVNSKRRSKLIIIKILLIIAYNWLKTILIFKWIVNKGFLSIQECHEWFTRAVQDAFFSGKIHEKLCLLVRDIGNSLTESKDLIV